MSLTSRSGPMGEAEESEPIRCRLVVENACITVEPIDVVEARVVELLHLFNVQLSERSSLVGLNGRSFHVTLPMDEDTRDKIAQALSIQGRRYFTLEYTPKQR